MEENKGIRLRKRHKIVTDVVRQLDSFPKMPTDYRHYTGIGGLVTVFTSMLMLILIASEILYFRHSRIHNKFVPDIHFNDKLKLTIDMTVAMQCGDVGADIVDVTNQESLKFGKFRLENTWFELGANQQQYFDEIQRLNTHLKEKYHALRDILWHAGYTNYFNEMPERSTSPKHPHDACRITGQLELNKVAGNFHVTLGKSLTVPGGHIHLQQLFPFTDANFSHRIDKFYFGDLGPGILHPLDSTLKIATNSSQIYKYFIQVVSTNVDTSKVTINTYQYSVKELSKFSDPSGDSHEMTGIFFKYDMNPLQIIIREDEYTFLQLVLRIFSCAGGLYIIAGLLNNLFYAIICNKYGQTAFVTGYLVIENNAEKTARI